MTRTPALLMVVTLLQLLLSIHTVTAQPRTSPSVGGGDGSAIGSDSGGHADESDADTAMGRAVLVVAAVAIVLIGYLTINTKTNTEGLGWFVGGAILLIFGWTGWGLEEGAETTEVLTIGAGSVLLGIVHNRWAASKRS